MYSANVRTQTPLSTRLSPQVANDTIAKCQLALVSKATFSSHMLRLGGVERNSPVVVEVTDCPRDVAESSLLSRARREDKIELQARSALQWIARAKMCARCI
eukprot:5715367-Amphidinium_carterae.1